MESKKRKGDEKDEKSTKIRKITEEESIEAEARIAELNDHLKFEIFESLFFSDEYSKKERKTFIDASRGLLSNTNFIIKCINERKLFLHDCVMMIYMIFNRDKKIILTSDQKYKIFVYLCEDVNVIDDFFTREKLNQIDNNYIILQNNTTYKEGKSYILLNNIVIPEAFRDKHLYVNYTSVKNINNTIKNYNLKNITIFGSVENIGDDFLRECYSLTNVNFKGLSALQEVYSNWMYGCTNLVNVDFIGLSALKTIGRSWMSNCNALVIVIFSGLSSLKEVGDNWLSVCNALKEVDFTGLSALVEVRSYWMYGCNALEKVNLTGLSSLKEIGINWLSECPKLSNPDFSGLTSLTTVGGRPWTGVLNDGKKRKSKRRSLKRKSIKRKSIKRKSIKRKSIKRKSIKRRI